MTRYEAPMLKCDGNDGWCDAIATDYYEQGASGVDGTKITPSVRHPGWHSEGDEDYCPEHQPGDPS